MILIQNSVNFPETVIYILDFVKYGPIFFRIRQPCSIFTQSRPGTTKIDILVILHLEKKKAGDAY